MESQNIFNEDHLSFQEAIVKAIVYVCGGCASDLIVTPVKVEGFSVFRYQVICANCLDLYPGLKPRLPGVDEGTTIETSKQKFVPATYHLGEIDRFWSKVHIPKLANGKNDFRACWNWLKSKDKKDYGWFRGRDRVYRSNRYAYTISHMIDPIDNTWIVRHICNNPSCCNPSHLIRGTPQDNTRDALLRNRRVGGRKMDFSKVTRLIQDHERGMTTRELSERYGIGCWQCQGILKGYSWWYVKHPDFTGRYPRKANKKPRPYQQNRASNQSKSEDIDAAESQ